MKRKARYLLGLFAAALLSLTAQAKVTALDPWVRATVDGQVMGGAFVTLKNDGASTAVLESAQSNVAHHIELHHMQNTDGMMQMVQISAIEIPAQQSVVLAPKGLHLMLMGLKRTLRAGETVPFVLIIKQNGRTKSIRINATVRELAH